MTVKRVRHRGCQASRARGGATTNHDCLNVTLGAGAGKAILVFLFEVVHQRILIVGSWYSWGLLVTVRGQKRQRVLVLVGAGRKAGSIHRWPGQRSPKGNCQHHSPNEWCFHP